MINPQIEASWLALLQEEFQKPYFEALKTFLQNEKKQFVVYPPGAKMFRAFELTPFENVKVVLLGQDPYHGEGQAEGLCFSVPPGIRMPPSLMNMFKEIQSDLGIPYPPSSGHLEPWAKQGVFLLNTCLSVRAHTPLSHQGKGWENFTDAIIQKLSEEKEHLVFLLWGSHAQSKEKLIDTSKHYILKSVHPSPLSASRGFFGCKHFSQCNAYLQAHGKEPIDWKI